MRQSKYTILSNKQVSERYWHMEISVGTDVEHIRSGQFFNLLCSDRSLPFLRRPLSVYKINRDRQTIEFLYLIKGIGTVMLTTLQEGEQLDVVGPLGVPFQIEEKHRVAILLARGVGIATLTALAQEISEAGKTCVAILSARTKNDLLASQDLNELGVHVFHVTEEEQNSDVPAVAALLDTLNDQFQFDVAYTCGSKRLSKLMQSKIEEFNIEGQIALEEHMACGMGVCFACVCNLKVNDEIQSARVCTEGPVFDLKEVILS